VSPGEPFLLVQLSDPHVREDDAEPERMLADAVRRVAAMDPAPGAVLLTGDLTEHGYAHEYARVREVLAPLGMALHVLGGNHDDREAMRAAFPPAQAADGDYRYTTRCGPLRLVVADTTTPGRIEGRLGDERLAWIDARLSEERETPTMLAMHHPPLHIGIPAWDAIGLPAADHAALGDVLAGHPQVVRVVAGHVHRAALGTSGGRPVFTCPSTWVQGLLDFGRPDELGLVHEPPAYAVHAVTAGAITTHVQSVAEG
jgi:3',5'-cyclic AMP phosphodiesterase CpdA